MQRVVILMGPPQAKIVIHKNLLIFLYQNVIDIPPKTQHFYFNNFQIASDGEGVLDDFYFLFYKERTWKAEIFFLF